MSNSISIGLLQMNSVPDMATNLAKAEKGIASLAKKGAQIVCLPELFAAEYFCQNKDESVFQTAELVPEGSVTQMLMKAARENIVSVITSVYEQGPEGKRFNTAVVINPDGSLAGKYRKMHIPYDPEHHYDEGFYFGPGDLGCQVMETQGVKVGPMICYDQWFPEGARIAAQKGAQILFYPTAIGWPPMDRAEINEAEHEAWQVMHRSHAIANNVFVVAVNHVQKEKILNFWGTSMVADPYGRVIGKAPSDAEAELVVECDLTVIDEKKKDWPFLEDVEREAKARAATK